MAQLGDGVLGVLGDTFEPMVAFAWNDFGVEQIVV
jgi:hypothetical protein